MLTLLLVLVAPSQGCTEVKQQCRACTVVAGRQQCSTIGIACQPVVRVCQSGRERGDRNKAARTPTPESNRPR